MTRAGTAVIAPGFLAALLGTLGVAHIEATAHAQVTGSGPHIKVTLVSESRTPAAGKGTTLAILMEPDPGWHGYWHSPGDTGLATKFTWTLPPGVSVAEPRYPVPGMLMVAGLMSHVYDRPYALLASVTMAADLPMGTALPLKLKLAYLVCTSTVCVPESAAVTTELTVGDGAKDLSSTARFETWRHALPRPLATPGTYAIDHDQFRLAVSVPAALDLKQLHLYADTADAISPAAPQSFYRQGGVLIVETKAAGSALESFDGVLALGDGTGLEVLARPGSVPAGGSSAGSAAHGKLFVTLVALVGAVLGGLILNVMPCVFPILSLKALSLARGGTDNATARREALAYAAGVIVVCVALGALILSLRAAGAQVGWAFQLQKPPVIFMLILLMSAIGFNLAGLFELGSLTVGSNLAAQSGVSGAFWTGALAAFVATPCTGPFMAAALGAAFVLPVAAALLVFFGLGLGLALPFLAIGFIAALRHKLPRPGAWMAAFRNVLAVPMFLTTLGLAWVIGNQTGTVGIIIALAGTLILSIGLWVMGLRQRALKERAWIPAAVALLLAVGGIALLPGATASGAHAASSDAKHGVERFDPQKLASLRAAGTPVFLYLTADWCLTCKVNEVTAIDRPDTQAAFAKAGVVTMVGDWTNGNTVIGDFLEAQGRSGVPMYLWYSPGKDAQVLPQVLTSHFLIGLAKGSSKVVGANAG